jgi:hypothetical protein
MYIVCIIIILIIIVLAWKSLNLRVVEGYDDRIVNTNLYNCSHLCKTIYDCYGFAYDDKHKTCFPSRKIIDNQTQDFLFKNDISLKNHIICNKFIPIIKPNNNPSIPERKNNAIYTCSDKEGTPVLYYENQGTMTHLDTGQNPDFLLDVDEYQVSAYDWPNGKIIHDTQYIHVLENNNLNKIQKTVSDLSVYLNDGYISKSKRELIRPTDEVYKILSTNIEHLTNVSPKRNSNIKIIKSPISISRKNQKYKNNQKQLPIINTIKQLPTQEIKKKQDQEHISIKEIIQETKQEQEQKQKQKQDQEHISIKEIIQETKQEQEQKQELTDINRNYAEQTANRVYNVDFVGKNISKIFKIYKDYNNGIINKCVRNITEKDCLTYCNSNDKCVGVEWNPLYGKNKSVCCPYTGIGNFENRDKYNNLGKFYEKTHDVYSNKNIYMVYDNN